MLDSIGKEILISTQINATTVSWPTVDATERRIAYFYILSRDEKGRGLCRGGAYYVVHVRNEYARLRPHVWDMENGLHIVAFDVNEFLTSAGTQGLVAERHEVDIQVGHPEPYASIILLPIFPSKPSFD